MSTMKWQDRVIAVVNVLFGFILIPAILDSAAGHTINIMTSLPTMIGIFVLAICFYTMKLKMAFVAEVFIGMMWMILVIYGVTW